MKKTVVRLFILAIFLTLFPLSVSAKTSELGIKLILSSETVRMGDIVDVKISMTNYSDLIAEIGGIQLDIPMNTEYFEYVDKSNKTLLKTLSGDFVSGSYNAAKNQYTFMYAYMNSDGKALPRDNTGIISFQIKIKKDIAENKTVSIDCKATIADTSAPAKPITSELQAGVLKSDRQNSSTQSSPEESQAGSSPENQGTSPGDKDIVVDINEGNGLPWDKMVISNGDDKNIKTENTKEGILIKGDNLSDLKITASKDGKDAQLNIASPEKEVLVKEKDGKLEAFVDKDGDGIFETALSDSKDTAGKSPLKLILLISIPGLILIAGGVILGKKKIFAKK